MTIRFLSHFLLILLLIRLPALDVLGQTSDFQSWWELEAEKKITGKLDLDAELEQRFKNNSLQYSRTLLTLGASYDLTDYLGLAGGVRTVFLMDREQGLETRYRIHMDGSGNYDLRGYDLSLRIRFQYGFDDVPAFRYFQLNSLVNRNRLKVDHHIFGTRFDCFASVESWHGKNSESRWLTYAIRYSVGARFSPNFRSGLSLRYILEDEFNVTNPMLLHVLVLGYDHGF